MDPEKEQEVISFVTEITFLAISKDWDSEVASLITQLLSVTPEKINLRKLYDMVEEIYSCKPKVEFLSLAQLITSFFTGKKKGTEWNLELSLFTQIIPLVCSMDLDLQQPKPESEFISIIKQIISLINSKPDSESELVSLITQLMRLDISMDSDSDSDVLSLIRQLVSLKPEGELISLIKKIISHFISMNWEPKPFISLRPRVEVKFEQGKFCVTREDKHQRTKNNEEKCCVRFYSFNGKYYFHCLNCNGEDHDEGYEKALVEVKHPLHPKHSLQLVLYGDAWSTTRECYCCDEDLTMIFYYCSACDYAMQTACVEKQPLLSIHHLKWHEHPLSLFPSHTSQTCNVCSLTDSRCPFYVCLPCDFVVHQNCISLPRIIRISRHPHQISFTPFFEPGDWSCGVCRKKIDNRYGGYSCFKGSCSYAAHSRCATQSNVWDGIELEGVPEEIEENIEPYVRISDGIIQHFSHQQHHLRLYENKGRYYDENKLCQACTTPIYFGNFYSCMQCEFILHENCANLSRKLHHQIHPHILTLVGGYDNVGDQIDRCSACSRLCIGAFVYKCSKDECHDFELNVQCATISEPLIYEGHMHPLFLTSKPGEQRKCSVCGRDYKETFNCIENECEFALCFGCATIPQKVRYKHDKHTLFLSYGEETVTMEYWCEACEKIINPKKGFYKCDEYCCVTLHIECLLGNNLYQKPGTSFSNMGKKVDVLSNNQHMSRPFCSYCKKRCLLKIAFRCSGFIFCRIYCTFQFILRGKVKAATGCTNRGKYIGVVADYCE